MPTTGQIAGDYNGHRSNPIPSELIISHGALLLRLSVKLPTINFRHDIGHRKLPRVTKIDILKKPRDSCLSVTSLISHAKQQLTKQNQNMAAFYKPM